MLTTKLQFFKSRSLSILRITEDVVAQYRKVSALVTQVNQEIMKVLKNFVLLAKEPQIKKKFKVFIYI